jgi:hypothetical protein
MRTDLYHIISETSEDRFGETISLEEAVRLARSLARESQAGDPVSIEHRGKVIRKLVLTPGGIVAEEEIH